MSGYATQNLSRQKVWAQNKNTTQRLTGASWECANGIGSQRSPRVLEYHPEVDVVATRRFTLRSITDIPAFDQHAALSRVPHTRMVIPSLRLCAALPRCQDRAARGIERAAG